MNLILAFFLLYSITLSAFLFFRNREKLYREVAQRKRNIELKRKVKQFLKSFVIEEKDEKLLLHLNFITHKHCSTSPPSTRTTSLLELYDNCRAACGEIAYVLKGLLTYYKIENRYYNIHNIPNQGNHTMVEANWFGKWVLLDPTFGLFFIRSGQLLSGDEVSGLNENELRKYVYQFSPKAKLKAKFGNHLYKQNFSAEYMDLSSFAKFEVSESELSSRRVLPFSVIILLKNNFFSIGDFETNSMEAASKAFLDDTNLMLNDINIESYNCISYNSSSFISLDSKAKRINYLKIQNLVIGIEYTLEILSFSNTKSYLNVTGLSKAFETHIFSSLSLDGGKSIDNVKFRPLRNEAEFILDVSEKKIRIYGYRVSAT